MKIIDTHRRSNFSEMLDIFYKNNNEKIVLQEKIEKILDGQRFKSGLDIGAGPGLLSESLYKRCEQLTLLELLPEYEKILKNNYPNAEVIIKSFLDLDPSLRFNLILASHVLYYFNDAELEKVLHKILQMLSPNGLLIIIFLDTTELVRCFSAKLSHLFRVNFINIQDFIQNLKQFGQVRTVNYANQKSFSDEEEFIDYLYYFFTLEDKKGLLDCKEEIINAKRMLYRTDGRLILPQQGKILILCH